MLWSSPVAVIKLWSSPVAGGNAILYNLIGFVAILKTIKLKFCTHTHTHTLWVTNTLRCNDIPLREKIIRYLCVLIVFVSMVKILFSDTRNESLLL